jgi:hypothetical protein
MAVINGDLTAAAELIPLARSAAREGQLKQISSLVDFTEADLHLASHEPELAWRLIPRALSTRQRRLRAIDNNGKASRLTMYWLFATRGAEALSDHFKQLKAHLPLFRLSDQLEIAAFGVWFGSASGEQIVDEDEVRKEVDNSGLCGILGILRAVGTSPTGW